jgi:hypothetical protein
MGTRLLGILICVAMAAALLQATTVLAQPPPPFFGPEDLNGDGAVNGLDFAIFDAAYIAYRDHGTYTAKCDFNSDGKVNYYDAMLMVEAYLSVNK